MPQAQRSSFNSTMVRLKDIRFAFVALMSAGFQFHNGSIKRSINHFPHPAPVKFQFHNGSIKRPPSLSPTTATPCFNSTMVRLKVAHPSFKHLVGKEFQFHNGSIKSAEWGGQDNLNRRFNSTMVRLKAEKINRDIIQNPHYFYKEKTVSSFKSRQRPVVRNSREVDDMAWLCLKLR